MICKPPGANFIKQMLVVGFETRSTYFSRLAVELV